MKENTFWARDRLLRFLRLSDAGNSCVMWAHRLRRDILRRDQRLSNDYLRKTTRPKLQIGGGWHRLDEWLNTDLEVIPDVMRMDATKRFPFMDETFQYVYTEHVIEHLPYQKGVHMLQECHRVMRKGGVIRVVTPDLAVITGLYSRDLSADQHKYLLWFWKTFVPEECPRNTASAINTMFRLWGHQFIYDEETLAAAMCAAGFRLVTRWPLGDSDHPELQNLENEQRYPEGLLNFESVVLEGCK